MKIPNFGKVLQKKCIYIYILVKIPNFFVDLTTTERRLFNIVDFNFKAITLN